MTKAKVFFLLALVMIPFSIKCPFGNSLNTEELERIQKAVNRTYLETIDRSDFLTPSPYEHYKKTIRVKEQILRTEETEQKKRERTVEEARLKDKMERSERLRKELEDILKEKEEKRE